MSAHGWLDRLTIRFAVLAMVAGVLLWGAIHASSANAYYSTAVGSFEIDGNTPDSAPGEPVDWDDAASGVPPITITPFTDPSAKQGDNGFTNGSKQEQPGGWTCGPASSPQKNDILSGKVGFRTISGKQFAYVNFTRDGVDGTADLDYEFSQSTTPDTPGCPQLPQRTQGDILIAFDVSNGGATIQVRAFRWDGDNNIGMFTELPIGSKGTTFDGASNASTSGTKTHEGNFGEAVLNLTDTIGNITCGEFNTVYMKSRSSTSITSALQDLTLPKTVNTGACPISNLAKAVRNVTKGEDFGTAANPRTTTTAGPGNTIEYRLTYKNSGSVPASNVNITDAIQPRQTFLSCTSSPPANPAPCSTSGSPINQVSWHYDSVAAGATVVVTFQVRLDATFPNGDTTVSNVGVVCTHEEPSCTNSNTTTVTVTSHPNSSLAKAVRNVTAGQTDFGPDASPRTSTNASPGDTIEYRLTYKNTGTSNATNVNISDPIPAHSTYVAGSCTSSPAANPSPCSTTGSPVTSVSWHYDTVTPGTTIVLTFRVRLDTSFPSGTTTITNVGTVCTAEEGCKDSPPVTVIVSAAPNLSIHKDASRTSANPDDQITYTLTATNNGNADATNTTITEAIPGGTQFVSCSDGCTVSGSTVTWSIGTLTAGGGTKSVTLTVKVLNTVGCQICNIAHVASPAQNGGTAVDSNQVCVDSTPGPNPAGAHAHDSALGAHVQVDALNINQTLTPVSSSVTGVGSDAHSANLLNLNLPDANAGLLHAGLLETSSASRVTTAPAEADHVSTADTADVKVLKGVGGVYAVTADVVRAVAHTNASGDDASFSSAGSTITNLVVGGVGSVDVKPNETVDLPDALFGPNSYVVIDAETGSTSTPAAGQTSGGTYSADLGVTMIRVHTDDLPLTPRKDVVDITVAQAIAHSDFPQTRLCTTAPTQAVSGHAFIASETTDPTILPILSGFSGIPTTGGNASQHVLSVLLPDSGPSAGSVVTTGVANSTSSGTRGATTSTASSEADAANVCLLKNSGVCTILAEAVKSQSNSTANGTTASSNDTGTNLVNVSVAGTPLIATTPPPNTVLTVPGIGFVILNEQVCDNGTVATHTCSGTTHSGLTVTAIHVVVLKNALGVLPGADIRVAEAHSDATFIK